MVRIPAGKRILHQVVQPAIYWLPRVLCRVKAVQSVKLITQLHVVLKVRNVGRIPTLFRMLLRSAGGQIYLNKTENYRGSSMKREDYI